MAPRKQKLPRAEARASLTAIGGPRELAMLFTQQTASGINVTETTALNIASLFRAGTVLSQSQAQIPVEVGRDKDDTFTPVKNHRVSDLLNLDASDNDSSFMLREQVAWDAFWYGDGFAEIEYDVAGRTPLAWHYIEAHRVQVRIGANRAREYVVDGNTKDPLPAKQIFHLPGLQFNGRNGKGIVKIARESLGHTIAIDQHGATTFGNNGIPSGIIETAFKVADETKTQMRDSFKSRMKNDVAVMDQGDKFIPLGLSNVDTQFLESRRFQVIEVSRWTGVPPHMLMAMEDSNYNSLEFLGGEFKALTLVPWCERWRGETRRKLFTLGERRVRYDVRYKYDAFLRADRKQRYEAHGKGITTGFLTPNEARADEGLPPKPGGDDLFTPLNMVDPNDPTPASTGVAPGQAKDTGTESGTEGT